MRKMKQESGILPRKVRALRAICWGGLIFVQLFLLHCLDTQAMMVTLPEKEVTVRRDIVYEAVEDMAEIPEWMSFEVEEDGRTAEAECRSGRKTVIREWWSPEFSFPVVFHGCDAGYFQLENVMIPYEADKPQTVGHEELLLELIGASPEFYRVTDVVWDGEMYRAEDGEVCRNAIASGEKLLRDYRVHYVGSAVFPEVERLVENVDGEISEERETMTESSDVAGLPADGEAGMTEDFRAKRWRQIIRTVTLALSLLFLIFILMMIILVKQRKMKYTDNADDQIQEE